MRDELHLMELVDRYFDGSMNAEERKAFEARANTNAELRQLIEDQRALREGVARVPVRAAAAKAYRSYRLGKPGPWIGGAAVIAVIVATTWLVRPHGRSEVLTDSSAPSEASTQIATPAIALADTNGAGIAPLVMIIDPNKDTAMLTPSGVLLDVPKGSFVDSAGRTVTTAVRITMLEAFDAPTIMKAGLSTMSGDTLLETGGMFYISAQSEGKEVAIASGRALNMLIPADGTDPRMMLYDGIMRADSVVDWKSPKPLPRTLVPVDITTLDFYPPDYEAKLAELGQDARNKVYRDSLYYSFECGDEPSSRNEAPSAAASTQELYTIFVPAQDTAATDSLPISASNQSSEGAARYTCGISPSKVKAIWNPRFNGTNLATREFEERMRSIHGTCDNAVLDLYVNNLTEDLRSLDRRAAQLGHSEFLVFAKRNDGRVDLPAEGAERLKRIYADWSRKYADATRAAQDAFWSKQRELDAHAAKLSQADRQAEQEARNQLLQAETEANLKSVYSQMGYATVPDWVRNPVQVNAAPFTASAIALPSIPRTAFRAAITSTGWKNCDVAFSAAYTRRTERMGSSGKRAVLTYEPCVVVVPDASTYDVVRVYLMPQEGRAYQRMQPVAAGRYQENLNQLYTYDAVVLAQKEGRRYFYEYKNIKGRSALTASLAPVTEQELTKKLAGYERSRGMGLLDASNYLVAAAKDMKRNRANMDRVRLRAALLPVVFRCVQKIRSERGTALVGVSNIMLQNVLTPDGDGMNDRLIIPGGPFSRARMRVRDGQDNMIFSKDDLDPSWNGRLASGRPAPAGTYLVTVEAQTPDGRLLAGRERVRLMWPGQGDSMEPVIFTIVEEMPQFPGGEMELFKYLSKTIKYPETAQKAGINGKVYMTFVVDENGNVRDPKVQRGIGGGCDEEAMRVVKGMPAWNPGKQRGKPVRVQYILPILFSTD